MSGQHIKTINGVNIVGPGDVSIYEVDKLLGIDSSLDIDSSNAIMNSTVTKEFDELKDYINDQDSSITNYIKNQDSSLETYIDKQDSSITDAITWENISKVN